MAVLLSRRPYLVAAALTLVLLILNLVVAPQFGNPINWAASLGTLAPFVLVGLASTPAVLVGGIDVSIGPLATFVNCIFVAVLIPAGLGSLGISLPLLLAIGAGAGAINGVLVSVVRLTPVVATVGMLFVLTGASLVVADNPVSAPENWTSQLSLSIGWFPGAIITIAAPLILWALLKKTSIISNLYAVGGDEVAAFGAGVSVTTIKILSYALGGFIAAIAGIALTSLIQSSQSSLGTTYALIALAAVVLGGTQLGGGRGGMIGTLFGAASIYLLQQFLAAVGVSSNLSEFVYGIVLIAGVTFSAALIFDRSRRTV